MATDEAAESPQSPPRSPPEIRGHQNNLSISMNNNGGIPRSALSPVSVAGSEWSGISKYNSAAENDLMFGGAPLQQPQRPPSNVSPPASIARSSDGTGLYASSEGSATLKNIALEEQVAVHHAALAKWLRDFLETKGSIRPNRARDKLLRLSAIQFQELSTDVYDELQRREPVVPVEDEEVPPFLLPKQDFHPKRNQARQKLSTLPPDRFRDLATDVFYELERRFPRFSSGLIPAYSPHNSMDGRGMPPPGHLGSPGLPSRVGSPGPMRMGSPGPGMMGRGGPYGPSGPPPNGYRGPPRGPPPNGGPPGTPRGPPNSFGRPLPSNLQNSTIIPNKSTMVEDDDDEDDMDAFGLEDKGINGQRRSAGPGRRESSRSMASRASQFEADKRLIADYQSKIEVLHDKVAGLEATLHERDNEIRSLKASGSGGENEWEELRTSLEGRLADAENLNNNLRSELDKVQAESAKNESLQQQLKRQEEQLRAQQDEIEQLRRGGGGGGSEEYQELLRQHEDLKQELKEQEEVTEEVRREAMEFLNQMKVISERADHSFEREEKLNNQIQKLQSEVQEWKSRYAKAKTTIRSIRSSSLGLQVPTSGGLFGKEGNLVDARGLIKAVHLTKFQIAIDELLKVARSINFGQSLEQVKSVVIATRALTQDISGEQNDAITRLKARISATANNLTTAAKNHATGAGLSPVSLLDAAASHLTASVIELVKLVRIRPTQEGESDEDEDYIASATAIDDEEMQFSPHDENRYVPVGANDSSEVENSHVNGNGHHAVPELDVNGAGQRLSNDSMYSPLSSPRGSSSAPRSAPRSRDGSAILGETVGTESKNWGRGSGPAFGIRTSGSDVEELRVGDHSFPMPPSRTGYRVE
ncbi:hypothetical protein FN846DRAFT_130288 [Sphaerosporella brunnea]|uniref:GIT Spa2 homology (SHD) domain-containing protein n=1 Tax=Sphaerosporella brunnea TaxID=1250544 RepID=A0A5J5F841_9PEZI|nr:hypothetical protein FN846DRAFT_130288 [Sphaerosporella brunnea]